VENSAVDFYDNVFNHKGIIRWSEEKTIDKNKKPPTQILRRWLYLQSI